MGVAVDPQELCLGRSISRDAVQRGLVDAVNQSDDPLIFLSPLLSITKLNAVAKAAFQESSDSVIGRALVDVIASYDNALTRSLLLFCCPDVQPSEGALSLAQAPYHWRLFENFTINGRASGFLLVGYIDAAEPQLPAAVGALQLIQALPQGLFWQDPLGHYLGCNLAFAQLLGQATVADVLGKTDADLLWSTALDTVNIQEQRAALLAGQQAQVSYEITLPASADSSGLPVRVLSVTLAPRVDETGVCVGLTGLVLDITTYKQTEETLLTEKNKAYQASQAKSDFLASMSHDLRTPLNSIMMAAQFLQANTTDAGALELLQAIAESSEILSHLVEDVLNFSEIEAGKLAMRTEAFDFRHKVESVLAMMAHKAAEKQIALIVSYSEATPRHVVGDALCLHKILSHLVDNAIKFTHAGYVLVGVEVVDSQCQDEDRVLLKLFVKDTGPGIPKAQQQEIFERFSRIDPAYKGTRGLGLGLSAVKELVERVEGQLELISQTGRGSTFSVTVPLVQQALVARYSMWYRHYSNVKVLVVDDLAERGQVTVRQLAANTSRWITGDRVLGELAAAHRDGLPYDMVLVDDGLTVHKAAELARQIRADVRNQGLMMILLRQPCSVSDAQNWTCAGFAAQLVKPVMPTELLRALAHAWGQWQIQQSSPEQWVRQLQPLVLLYGESSLTQKVLELLLAELGCLPECVTQPQTADLVKMPYDLVFVDVDGDTAAAEVLIKAMRKNEDLDQPIPIVMVSRAFSERDHTTYRRLGVTQWLQDPIDPKVLSDLLLQCLLAPPTRTVDTLGQFEGRKQKP